MKHPTSRVCALTAAVLALVFWACEDRMAGNGSEVENAVVVGEVSLPPGSGGSNQPATAVRVGLYPASYNAMEDDPLPPSSFAQTKADGKYRIAALPGVYNLFGIQASGGGRVFIQNVTVGTNETVEVGDSILKAPGRLRVTLPQGSWEGGYLYVPGTPLAVKVDSAADSSGTLLLDSVPECRLPFLYLARTGRPNSSREIAHDIVIVSGQTTNLPFTEWNYSAAIRVDASGMAARLSGNVTGIPVLLRLDRGNFDFGQARGNGGDIRFTRENGAILPCHVQDWDSAGAHADVWIKMDTVFADTHAHRILMHWGNSKATMAWPPATAGDGAAVFDTADGYVGAWHLDAPPAGAGGFQDQSSANNGAKPQGQLALPDTSGLISAANGVIGPGVGLNGKDAYLLTSNDIPGPAGFTVSLWFRTSTKEGGKIVGFVMPSVTGTLPGRPGNFNFDRVVWMDNDGLLHAGFTMRSTDYPKSLGYWQSFTAAKPYNDGAWHQLAYALGDSGAVLYVDGVKAGGYSGLVSPLPINGHWRVGYVGDGMWDPQWTSEYFQASMDEVRIIHKTHSEDWLKLDFESQRSGSSLLTLEKP